MNKPYQKEYKQEVVNESGIDYVYTYDDVVLNPITKENPYLHSEKSARGKSKRQYHMIHNHITGKFIGKMKLYGNNRANTSKRSGANSRNYYN